MFLIAQCVGYLICLILGFSILIPSGLNFNSFHGRCLLFSGANVTDNGEINPNWASPFYCISTMAMGFITVTIAMIQLTRSVMMLRSGIQSSFKTAFVETTISIIITLAILANAILVSIGFSHWCDVLVDVHYPKGCDDAARKMRFPIYSDEALINPSGFYIEMQIVHLSIWSCFVSWAFILGLSGCKLFIHHEADNLVIGLERDRRRNDLLPENSVEY